MVGMAIKNQGGVKLVSEVSICRTLVYHRIIIQTVTKSSCVQSYFTHFQFSSQLQHANIGATLCLSWWVLKTYMTATL